MGVGEAARKSAPRGSGNFGVRIGCLRLIAGDFYHTVSMVRVLSAFLSRRSRARFKIALSGLYNVASVTYDAHE